MKFPGRFALLAAFLFVLHGAALAQGNIFDRMARLDAIRPGVTTAEDVRQLLGAPGRTMRFPRDGIDVLEYYGRDYGELIVIQISIAHDGKVKDIRRFKPNTP